MKRDGSAVSQLTNSPSAGGFADDFTPAFSPDGRTIAFSRFRDVHDHQIYAMDADGSDARRLTCMPNGATEPAFSPDGQKIAFVSETARNPRPGALSADWDLEIYLMDADGSGETQLTQKGGSEPAFSPDGRTIAFSSCRHDHRKREQGGLNDCPGTAIFRDGNSEIYVMDADGSERRLTHAAAADYDPAFSPDGQQIAFTSERDGNSEIYVMDADGSGETQLTQNGGSGPAFSPDGQQIAFTSERDGNSEIYLMDADGSGETQLTQNGGSGTAFSPDGRQIAFTSYRDGNWEIYVMDADGSDVRRLTNHPAADTSPAWGP